jgi:hypothetical protein
MAKVPPFIYAYYRENHFVTNTNSGITCQVHVFNILEEVIEFEHNSIAIYLLKVGLRLELAQATREYFTYSFL